MISGKSWDLRTFVQVNHKPALWFIIAFFGVIFCLISLINHYQLRTYALDLGMYNQAAWSYAHFKQAIFTLGIDGREVPFPGTHFSLITILYSPFYYLFGSYSLLIIQIASVLAGGYGIYKYSREQFGDDQVTPLIILFQFFTIWGIYSALSFDFHDSVLGAMMVPWLVYFIEKRRLVLSGIFFILILLTKEVMAFWLFFILIGLMIKNRRKFIKEYLNFEVPAVVFCLFYGVAVTVFIMPQIQGTDVNLQLARYSHLGDTTGEILLSLIRKPQYFFSLLFENISGNPAYNGIKTEFHLVALLSGGIFLFFRPVYLFMLIPVYGYKFLSDDYALWGINYQYSIEFVPIISFALIDGLKGIKRQRVVIALLITLLTLGVNITTLEGRASKWYNKPNARFYAKEHYTTPLDFPEIYRALKLVDNNEVISGSSAIIPHLANRTRIYHFPVVKDANYIVLLTRNTTTYPLQSEEYENALKQYKESLLFETVYSSDYLLILKRKVAGFQPG